MQTFYFTAVVTIFLLLVFLAYSQRSQIGCLPYFDTRCGFSANLEYMSEMCCRQLAGNTGGKNYAKIAICAPSHNFVGLYLRNEGMYRQMEKDLLNSNISSTCLQNMVNVGLLTDEITLRVWAPQQISTGFAVKLTLHDVWPSPGLVHYIYIFGVLDP